MQVRTIPLDVCFKKKKGIHTRVRIGGGGNGRLGVHQGSILRTDGLRENSEYLFVCFLSTGLSSFSERHDINPLRAASYSTPRPFVCTCMRVRVFHPAQMNWG